MAIVKKGSRLLTIDDTTFRWKVRHKPSYSQAIGAVLTFAVELAVDPGRTLVVFTPWHRPDNWLEIPGRAITPRIVENAVRTALAAGWHPNEPGPQRRLAIDA
ncbi:hypothetical protein [Catenuloplanes atrovinosus]|uniref:Uncharacterized protein n=1 Tax=Catenuloplanes atrovinosus TaxID=137266 RepID=A0AAE3YVE2_9ACTN|nr:hypothetical protein [Catenuloplanes atrovinosus]MDR7278706.1 hypothetical protein [Catenuloplanes atrovinosus]